ncbi:zinc finger protein 532-like isoform X2 [Dermacentor albipictus]|uniref:zinc finger protein 532-like isoform X2 n=1 Tax=Dermacentor albipictus TaxID=60249 RepID=UPI0031FD81FA
MSQASRVRCCVLGCSATYQSTDESGEKVRFFGFPARPHDIQRKNKWIDNIRLAREDVKGAWSPSKNSKVCSRHFVGNVKGEDPREANYIPTIFPVVSSKTAEKYNRLLKTKQNAKAILTEQSPQKPLEASKRPRGTGETENSLPSSKAATREVARGTTMEGQRAVHLASVVDGDGSLESGVHVTLDEFLREWSVDPYPRYAGTKCEENGPADPGHGSKERSFECPICADSYTTSRSLRRHLSRRSFLARLPCRKCGSCHLAFNRCTLIMKAQGCRIAASSATLSALPPGETLVPVELTEEGDSGASQTDVPMTVLEKVLQSVVCSECYVNLEDEAYREDHFHPSRGNLIRCTNCPMLCTSECALRAHRRLHTQRRPFVCPECGLRCEDEWAVFHRHVTKHCHHFERIVGYHCQLCPALLLDQAELAGHIVDTHSSALHKCQACPMAFINLEGFHIHRQAAHPKLRSQCWLILKCPLCEAVFASAELLTNHTTSHLDQCGRSLFKCSTCDSLHPTRTDLVAHVRKLHPDMHQATLWGKEEDPILAFLTGKKETADVSNEVINLDDDEPPDSGDKAMDTSPPQAQKLEKGSPEKPAPASNAPSDQAQKDNRGAPKKVNPHPTSESEQATVRQDEKPPNSAHMCAKCDFQSSDLSVFREHIKVHRPLNQETFQCLECGLCYVVEPSLRKHLRGVHRVEETQASNKLTGTGPNGATVSGLRCSVCLATFDTERELKSHTRSHGMAFLKKVKAKDGTI